MDEYDIWYIMVFIYTYHCASGVLLQQKRAKCCKSQPEIFRAEVLTLPTAYPTKMMALSGAFFVARTVDITRSSEYFR